MYIEAISKISQTKKEIAKGIRISPRTISRWFSGESKPKPCNIRDLKVYLNKTIIELQRLKNSL